MAAVFTLVAGCRCCGWWQMGSNIVIKEKKPVRKEIIWLVIKINKLQKKVHTSAHFHATSSCWWQEVGVAGGGR